MSDQSFTLTIVGAGPACPNAGGSCSGYLLRHGESAVLVDCGSGVVGHLRQHVAIQKLTAIVISHLHADHYFDLVPLYYGLKYGEPRSPEMGVRTPLFLPPGGWEHSRRFGQLVSGQKGMFDDVFDIREYSAERPHQVGPFRFSFHPVQHYILSHAMRIQVSETGPVLVFSSDAAPCPQLVDAARHANLFLCESALRDASEDNPDPTKRGHLSAREAGVAARDAAVDKLLITHYQSRGGTLDEHHLKAARSTFPGPVVLAKEGETYRVG